MSKMDQLRALREAKYAHAVTHVAVKPAAAPRQPAVAPEKPARAVAAPVGAEPAAADPEAQLCGHRAISGRTCTREHGHAAKSHRYS